MKSLSFRIAFTYAALIVVAMAALGWVLLRAQERRYIDTLDTRLLAEAGLVAEAARPLLVAGAGIDGVDPLAKRLGADGRVRVTIIAPDGTVLGDSENDPHQMDLHAGHPEVAAALQTDAGRATRRSATEGQDFTYLAIPVRDGGQLLGIVRVATPSSSVNSDLHRIGLSVAVAALAMTLAAATLAIFIAGAIAHPLGRLRHAARSLAGGAYDHRVETSASNPTEIAELASAFNDMAARLRDTITSLGQERSRLEALLASSTDALIALDQEGVTRYLNPAAVALLGEAEGRSFVEAARHHELVAIVERALGSGERATGSVYVDRRGIWLQVTASPITGGGGWALLVILHDVTEVRRAETTRRDFVANVSHELRTPLAGIKAVVETLRDGAMQDPATATGFLDSVDAEVDRLVQLVEELLQLARIESGAEMEMRDVAPADVLTACVRRFEHMAERNGVRLCLELPEALPHMRADAARLGQATGNLVHNALKFTPPGGSVTVAARCTGTNLLISVSDTGEGIDPADLLRIFERFYVADRARAGRGTGLGLAIVKHVIRAHGGAVDASSTLGKGSTFTITLPVQTGNE